MGQQQLLLLVLATVIVGLATVAGIQAFDENQTQATQDALTQKGVTIISDIKGLASKPQQFGGIDTTSTSVSKIANKLGYESPTIPVDGASGNANCEIKSNGTEVECTSDEAPQDVTVTLKPDTVTTSYSSSS